MRLRERRRIEKRARIAANTRPMLFRELAQNGPEELLKLALDPTASWFLRSEATKIISFKSTPKPLLRLFFEQEEKIPLWETALVLETAGRADVIKPLIEALLHDQNHHRRHAAARALGWNGNHRAKCAKALAASLGDHSQPQPVREEACESLAYLHWQQATPVLAAALQEPDVRIRFWAAFGLGGMRHRKSWRHNPQAVAALESVLGDSEVAPGNWWSVGLEALSMLANSIPKYRELEATEKARILNDPNASGEDRRWAEPNWNLLDSVPRYGV